MTTQHVDRTALEKAIAWLEETHSPEGLAVCVLLAAARAHLATLPEPTWKVRVDGRRVLEWRTRDRAIGYADGMLQAGARKVEIEAP